MAGFMCNQRRKKSRRIVFVFFKKTSCCLDALSGQEFEEIPKEKTRRKFIQHHARYTVPRTHSIQEPSESSMLSGLIHEILIVLEFSPATETTPDFSDCPGHMPCLACYHRDTF